MDLGIRLYAHRGSSARLPENTLEAFEQALDDGADALELDVHCSADGHVVVAHDPGGGRTAERNALIRDSSLHELRDWDVGSGFDPNSGAKHAMPTLSEVLDRFGEVPMSIDLKPDDREAAARLMQVLAEHDAEHRVIVGSFHDRLVYAMRRNGYPGPTALARGEIAALRLLPPVLSRRLARGQAAMIPRRGAGFRLDRRGFIRRCRRLGLRVDYWVVNEPGAARLLLERGATGIITDDPRRIVPVMEEFGRGRTT
jgi:glycerophosphoryl diester phosphodiesterase